MDNLEDGEEFHYSSIYSSIFRFFLSSWKFWRFLYDNDVVAHQPEWRDITM